MENKIEFNWEKYQSGAYDVVTRDGRKVEQLHKFDVSGNYPFFGVCNDTVYNWYSNGLIWDDGELTETDLFLIPKVKEGPIVEANETIIPELKGVLMEVSDDVDFRQFAKREVLAKYDNKYIVVSNIGHIVTYNYARPIKEIKECWVNVYENEYGLYLSPHTYSSKDNAMSIVNRKNYIKTIKITDEPETNEH